MRATLHLNLYCIPAVISQVQVARRAFHFLTSKKHWGSLSTHLCHICAKYPELTQMCDRGERSVMKVQIGLRSYFLRRQRLKETVISRLIVLLINDESVQLQKSCQEVRTTFPSLFYIERHNMSLQTCHFLYQSQYSSFVNNKKQTVLFIHHWMGIYVRFCDGRIKFYWVSAAYLYFS